MRLAPSAYVKLFVVASSALHAGVVHAEGDAETNEVVVQGTRAPLPTPPKDFSAAGSEITGDRLRAPGVEAADLLRTQPGLAVTETGGNGSLSTARIRGATSAQTPVYIGSVRVNDDVGGTADLSLIPLWLVDRIEIYRGNAPFEADQFNIGGAIVFEPRRPTKTEFGTEETLGSFRERSWSAHAAAGTDRAAALVGIRYEAANNDYPYIDDNGMRFTGVGSTVRRTNADEHTLDAWGLGTAALGESGQASILINHVDRGQGIPGLGLLPTVRARAHLSRTIGAVTLNVPCGAANGANGTSGASGTSRCTVTTGTAMLLSTNSYDDPLQEIGLGSSHVDVDARRVNQFVSVALQPWPSWHMVPTLAASGESLRTSPAHEPTQQARRLTTRAALAARWTPAEWAAAQAFAAAECNATSIAGSPALCDSMQPAARLGGRLGSNQFAVLANGGHYERSPTLGELYGVSGTTLGSPSLVAESGWTADLGVRAAIAPRGTFRGASLDVFVFSRHVDNLIRYRQSSLGYVRPFNVGVARISGIEFLAAAAPWRMLLAEVSATWTDARDKTPSRTLTNDILPYQSRLVFAPRLELNLAGRRSATDALEATLRKPKFSISYVYQSNRYADAAGLVVIPAQGSLDMDGQVEFVHHLTVRIRLADALNQSRFDVIGYPLPRRSLFAALEGHW
ncbi:MAG: TonB-dependent receptor [Polyangiaceae bacterium]|nr:TonB-dependent receptor [Polyangiaceae bacterium]